MLLFMPAPAGLQLAWCFGILTAGHCGAVGQAFLNLSPVNCRCCLHGGVAGNLSDLRQFYTTAVLSGYSSSAWCSRRLPVMLYLELNLA